MLFITNFALGSFFLSLKSWYIDGKCNIENLEVTLCYTYAQLVVLPMQQCLDLVNVFLCNVP